MSPTSDVDRSSAPLYSSTPIAPRTIANGYTEIDVLKNRNHDTNDNSRVTNNDNNDNRITCIDNGNDNTDSRVENVDNRIVGKDKVDSVDNRFGSVDKVDNKIGNDDGNGDRTDNGLGRRIDEYDTLNGNVNVNIVLESTNSMDVLSGGESDAGDTLSRRNNNNNSIASSVAAIGDSARRRGADVTYYVAKELLMTERTYKRDLELITVSWSKRVGKLGRTASSGAEAAALARGCLALEPLALPAGALLTRLDRALAATSHRTHDTEEPEYKKIAELLYDYLSTTFDAYAEYICNAGTLVALVESGRRRGGAAAREASAFDCGAPLPLACLLLRPLHRLLHYRRLAHVTGDKAFRVVTIVAELQTRLSPSEQNSRSYLALPPPKLWSGAGGAGGAGGGGGAEGAAHELASRAAAAAVDQLHHVENHAALCQLQRDLVGYDKLLVAGREFIRLGCLYKHSSKGLQQRMLFLFSDLLVISSKCPSGHFRAHSVLALHPLSLREADLPNSIAIAGDDVNILLSASNEQEYSGWRDSLAAAIERARRLPVDNIDTDLTPCDNDSEGAEYGAGSGVGVAGGGAGSAGGALAAVCWHRAASLSRAQLHRAMRTQLSGYLLRKFKNSHGWQKLWVVFAAFTLFFYKSWQDEGPLASLPLLGYSVGPPTEGDGIGKDFVFKLQYKNHVYFFRADSHFTYNRWIEVLQTPMVHSDN